MKGTWNDKFAYSRGACLYKSEYGTRGQRVSWFERCNIDEEDDMVLLYNSPTSGMPKGKVPIGAIEVVPVHMLKKINSTNEWVMGQ